MYNFTSFKRMSQITNSIMMIEPVLFNYNSETAVNNYYQKNNQKITQQEIQDKALKEFRDFVNLLRSKKINVIVFKDTKKPKKPDSIFPNNWISFHANGEIIIYPMYAQNRRLERRQDIIDKLKKTFEVASVKDFSFFEDRERYLEGTGSMILDRENKFCYAAISARTSEEVIQKFCKSFNYSPVIFSANQDVDDKRLPIYHTNVMMCIADDFAIICLDSIDCKDERKNVVQALKQSNKEIIEITEQQVNRFAGNMLQLKGDKKYLVMSKSAYNILSTQQIKKINSYSEILYSNLQTIEDFGGGSARCMMAEIFLPLKK